MKRWKCTFGLLLVLFLAVQVLAREEKVKIVKIIDANLFQIQDGRLIQLAHINTPSVNSYIPFQRWVARKAFDYARNMLLGKHFLIQYDSAQVRSGRPIPVYLFKIYPLEKLDINKLYLERGYGKFDLSGSSSMSKEYEAAEKYARQKHLGVWSFPKIESSLLVRRHRLYYRAGNHNLFGDEFREIGFHTHSESAVAVSDFRIAFVRSARKGRSCMECSGTYYYREYLYHYRTGYVQLIMGKKWGKVSLSLGLFGYISGSGYLGDLDDTHSYIGLSPIVRLRYFLPHDLYLKAALTDAYGILYSDYPVMLAIGKRFPARRLHVWSGLVKHRTRFNLVGGTDYDFGPYTVNVQFGHGLNYQSYFAELQVGFFVQ